VSESLGPLFDCFLFIFGHFVITVAPESAHPLGVSIDVVLASHVEDLSHIFLSELVLELLLVLFIAVLLPVGRLA